MQTRSGRICRAADRLVVSWQSVPTHVPPKKGRKRKKYITPHIVPQNCEFCAKQFTKNYLYQRHIGICERRCYRDMICELCEKFFKSQRNKKRHQNSVHRNVSKKMKKEKCDHCKRTFARKDNLQRHVRTVHG